MLRAILFDLDGTLLDIDLGTFLSRYFGALDQMTRDRYPGRDVIRAILDSTEAMQRAHPGRTNREVFDEDFEKRTGVRLEEEREVFDSFYAEEFPSLRDGAGPRPGARRAVTTALDLGLRVVVATQPIFPRAAIEHRLAWAGLEDLALETLTTYEVMHACKPSREYFLETAGMAGCAPGECLMVGDDAGLDMPASDACMRTFYVGNGEAAADLHGGMDDLADLLPALALRPDVAG